MVVRCFKFHHQTITPSFHLLPSSSTNPPSRNTSSTFSFEARSNVDRIAVSPDGVLCMVVDVDGHGCLVNLRRGCVLHRINFKGRVRALAFSPKGGYLATATDAVIVLWYIPLAAASTKTFAPMIKVKTIRDHQDDVVSLAFAPSGKVLISGSRDMTARVHSIFESGNKFSKSWSVSLASHREAVIGVFFDPVAPLAYTVAEDNAVFTWEWVEDQVDDDNGLRGMDLSEGEYSDGEEVGRINPSGKRSQIGASDSDQDGDEDESGSGFDEEDAAAFGGGWVNKESVKEMTKARKELGLGGKDSSVSSSGSNSGSGSGSGSSSSSSSSSSDDDDDDDDAEWMVETEEEKALNKMMKGGNWKRVSKHILKVEGGRISSVTMHGPSSLLVVGFTSGVFGLYQMPTFAPIHTLSVSSTRLTSVAVNGSGEWLAFGSSVLGQLVVWEWQSETFVLKQQGHSGSVNCVAYSPDGQYLATGADDGKVKLWSTHTGFCFVTFDDHDGPIADVAFHPKGQALFSASTDGTIRAFDMTRYRCFRTFATPTPAQLSTMAVDPMANVVVAGSLDEFVVYVWDIKTGKLLEMLAGHTAPVSALSFSLVSNMLVSGSWDGSIKIWDVFNSLGRAGGGSIESFDVNSSKSAVTAVAWAPNDRLVAVATMDGEISFWDPREGVCKGTISARSDISGGRVQGSVMTAANSPAGKFFTSLSFTADSACVVAGGESKFVCIYEVSQRVLIKRFQLSKNRSLDGVLDELNSKYDGMDEWNLEEDYQADKSHLRALRRRAMPGSIKAVGEHYRFVVSCSDVAISPTGRAWAAATPEGILVYSLDATSMFDPFDLDLDVTPAAALASLEDGEYGVALLIALRLNQDKLTVKVYERIPLASVPVVAANIPVVYLDRLMAFIARQTEATIHFHFHLLWIKCLFTSHARHIKTMAATYTAPLIHIQKALTSRQSSLAPVVTANSSKLKYLVTIHKNRELKKAQALGVGGGVGGGGGEVGMDVVAAAASSSSSSSA